MMVASTRIPRHGRTRTRTRRGRASRRCSSLVSRRGSGGRRRRVVSHLRFDISARGSSSDLVRARFFDVVERFFRPQEHKTRRCQNGSNARRSLPLSREESSILHGRKDGEEWGRKGDACGKMNTQNYTQSYRC